MRALIALIALCAPVVAQETHVVQVDETFAPSNPIWGGFSGTDYLRPDLPGQIHTVFWDLQVTVTGSMTATNTRTVPGVLQGDFFARALRYYQDFYGYVNGSVQSDVLQPGESQVLPFQASAHLHSYAPVHWAAEVPRMITTDWWRYEPEGFTPWQFVPANGGNSSGFWYQHETLGFNPDIQVHVTGTISWHWTPDIPGLTEVCAGDGIQRIGIWHQYDGWDNQTVAYSTYVGNYTMLFMGDYWAVPNSSFCIGVGQRINPSLRHGMIYFDWLEELVVSGQTYTLQAVHRHGYAGEVRFSNAVLFQVP